MCILFFIAGLLLMAGAIAGWHKMDNEDNFGVLVLITSLAFFVLGITAVISWDYIGDVVDGRYVDGKVAMYQEENKKIEQDVSEIVKQYMEHENQTFDMSRINSSTTLVQMYPELQSSEIVQKQIDIYYENNKKIKSLKNKEYQAKKAKFMLYFGGGK